MALQEILITSLVTAALYFPFVTVGVFTANSGISGIMAWSTIVFCSIMNVSLQNLLMTDDYLWREDTIIPTIVMLIIVLFLKGIIAHIISRRSHNAMMNKHNGWFALFGFVIYFSVFIYIEFKARRKRVSK